MKYLIALQQPRFAALWVSQVLSAFGDQLYLLAIMWIGVQSFGSNAAFIVAAGSITRIVFGLIGGILADRVNRGLVMLVSDIVRALAVATLPLFAVHGANNLWHLVAVSAVIGTFGSLFDPALQASLPSIASSSKSVEPMLGLVDVTQRIARAVSPSLAGLLIMCLPLSHFFTIDAASFLVSAGTIYVLSSFVRWQSSQPKTHPDSKKHYLTEIARDFKEGWLDVVNNRPLSFAIVQTGLVAGLWGCAFTVGVPLLVKNVFVGNVGSYGLIVGAYGLGNVFGNVVLANLHLKKSYWSLFAADVFLGLGFVMLSFSQNLPMAMLAAGIAAIGGAISDLLLLNLVMSQVPAAHVGKTLSMRLTVLYGGYSLGLIAAAPVFACWQPLAVILSCAILMIVSGIVGIFLFGRHRLLDPISEGAASVSSG